MLHWTQLQPTCSVEVGSQTDETGSETIRRLLEHSKSHRMSVVKKQARLAKAVQKGGSQIHFKFPGDLQMVSLSGCKRRRGLTSVMKSPYTAHALCTSLTIHAFCLR